MELAVRMLRRSQEPPPARSGGAAALHIAAGGRSRPAQPPRRQGPGAGGPVARCPAGGLARGDAISRGAANCSISLAGAECWSRPRANGRKQTNTVIRPRLRRGAGGDPRRLREGTPGGLREGTPGGCAHLPAAPGSPEPRGPGAGAGARRRELPPAPGSIYTEPALV